MVFAIYYIRWIKVTEGMKGTMFKLNGYIIGTFWFLIGIALIFDIIHLW